MYWIGIGLRNAWRSPLRTVMTVTAVALSLVGFLMMRTLGGSWRAQVEQTPNDRVVSRNKLGWDHDLPIQYADEIRSMPGVADAVAVRWGGLALAGKPELWVENNAVEARHFIDMHYELSSPREQREAFVNDRRGAFVSAALAKEFGWKLGDRAPFVSRHFSNPIELTIRGIFSSNREGFAHRTLYFHLEYLNQVLPLEQRERASIVAAKINDPALGASLAKAIDLHFDDGEARTLTMEDKALNAAITGRFSAILRAMNVVSLLTLAVVLLILLNTMVMSARERTQELATLRALGFGRRQIGLLLATEAAVLGACGGLLALASSFPVIERWVSAFASETLFLPPLHIHALDAVATVAVGLLIGLGSAILSIRRTFQLELAGALRYLD